MSTLLPAGAMPGRFVQGDHTLGRAAALVAAARGDLDTIGAAVLADAERLGGRWAGRGATAFAALAVAWQDRQRRVVAALDDLEAGLRGAEQTAVATDAEQQAGLLALQHALGAVPGR